MNETLAPPEAIAFNLWHAPWIRVLDGAGGLHMVSISAALTQAHTFRALYDPSPLVVCGIHRLLAAILQQIYAPDELADIGNIVDAGRFAPECIDHFAERHTARFDLFDVAAPFLQTGDVALDAWRKPEQAKGKAATVASAGAGVTTKVEPKSIAYLMAEVPAGTNRTHFAHVSDDHHRLCPACCARGLVTLPAFATSGGAGIKPSINGVPPLYLLPVGDTLFQSLVFSLVSTQFQPAVAAADRPAFWEGSPFVPRNGELPRVGYLESLTWPARRVRLFPRRDEGRCTQCDQPSPIRVQDMLFEMGVSRPKDAALWKDPFVAYRKPAKAKPDEAPLPLRPNQGRALWRDYSALFLAEADLKPALLRQLVALTEDGIAEVGQRLRFRCIGMKTDGKAKIFEWIDDALDVPPALLRDPQGGAAVRDALRRSEDALAKVRHVFTSHMKPDPNAKHERFVQMRGRMEDDYWAALAAPFRDLVATAATPEQVAQAVNRWGRLVLEQAERVLNSALEQVGERDQILRRRVEAQSHGRRMLIGLRKEWNIV